MLKKTALGEGKLAIDEDLMTTSGDNEWDAKKQHPVEEEEEPTTDNSESSE